MAEALLFSISGSVAAQATRSLGSPVLKELGMLWGLKGELQKLQNTVSAIQAKLLDAEEKQAAGDNAVRHWLARIEDVVYEADDLLDDFSTEGLLREMMTPDKKAKKTMMANVVAIESSRLTAILDWIHNWTSLEEFTIWGCPSLTSLPKEMRRLTSLRKLRIVDCPILLQRCERDIGEDWPKIAYIPHLDFE